MRTLRTVSKIDGASDLLTSLAERGHHLVLASSSESDLVDEESTASPPEPGSTSWSALGVFGVPRDLLDQLGDSPLARWPAFSARV